MEKDLRVVLCIVTRHTTVTGRTNSHPLGGGRGGGRRACRQEAAYPQRSVTSQRIRGQERPPGQAGRAACGYRTRVITARSPLVCSPGKAMKGRGGSAPWLFLSQPKSVVPGPSREASGRSCLGGRAPFRLRLGVLASGCV